MIALAIMTMDPNAFCGRQDIQSRMWLGHVEKLAMAFTEMTVTNKDIERRGWASLGDGFWERKPKWVGGNISEHDVPFLAGLINYIGPSRMLEIGVASGWSSAVMLQSANSNGNNARLSAIDLSHHYYLDKSIPTGQAVNEVTPDHIKNYDLLTGRLAIDVMDEIGDVDFVFIDAHHMHPWATLDMISVLPFISEGTWVAFHDLNLCRVERHQHLNRGPYYMFNAWPDAKLHSTQNPPMIGAVKMERAPEAYLSELLEILYTPWEITVNAGIQSRFVDFIGRHFGELSSTKFAAALSTMDQKLSASKT